MQTIKLLLDDKLYEKIVQNGIDIKEKYMAKKKIKGIKKVALALKNSAARNPQS